MLDAQGTFDDLVGRYATNPGQAEAILSNPVYRNISGALSGTQEYMAVEKLYELQESGAFDLIVVDTPPAQHALDFLEAPKHLARLLDNRVFRLLMVPTRAGLRAFELGCPADAEDDLQGGRRRGRGRDHPVLHPVRRHGGRLPGAGAARRRAAALRA